MNRRNRKQVTLTDEMAETLENLQVEHCYTNHLGTIPFRKFTHMVLSEGIRIIKKRLRKELDNGGT